MQTPTLKFAFLNNEEHPVGRLMLKRLCRHGVIPSLVVEERSSFAIKKTSAYLLCLKPDQFPESSTQLAASAGIPLKIVDNLTGVECEKLIRNHPLSMAILGNARIIKPNLLNVLSEGCINVHPGLLPWVRGAFPQCWSVLNDVPVGCTCHWVDRNVDTGSILNSREIQVFEGDTLEDIVARTMFASADLLIDTIDNLETLRNSAVSQRESEGTLFHWPSPDVLAAAREKLKTGKYLHMKSSSSKSICSNRSTPEAG